LQRHFLPLSQDSSTQGLKVTAIDDALEKVYGAAINFDRDLPAYKTKGGFHQQGNVVTTPTAMLAEAVDVLLDQMKSAGFDFSRVAAISGSGQQHGSVYPKD
jgi:xylulokinase